MLWRYTVSWDFCRKEVVFAVLKVRIPRNVLPVSGNAVLPQTALDTWKDYPGGTLLREASFFIRV